MIVFLNFENIGKYEMGKPKSNIWNRGKSSVPVGPKFASADWYTPHTDMNEAVLETIERNWDGPSGHRTEIIDLDLPIKKQLRRINGTPIIMLLFPVYIHDLKDDNNTLSKIIETFEPFPQVKFMFSNTWDMCSHISDGFNAVDYILDSVKDIDGNRLNFYLCNKYTVDAIKNKRPDIDARFMAVYFNRIKHFNPELYKHNAEQRTKHFLCLNNIVKSHRTYIVDRMPPEHSYVSYIGKDIRLPLEVGEELLLKNARSWQDSLPHFYYNDSYINIANETMHEFEREGYLGSSSSSAKHWKIHHLSKRIQVPGHITEKSLKPIYFRQMFLVVGYLGANKLMQDLGFKLFDNFIDYSFDNEYDPQLRLEQLSAEIKRLSDINIADIHAYYNSAECQDIIEHNLAVYETYCYNPTAELQGKYNQDQVVAEL